MGVSQYRSGETSYKRTSGPRRWESVLTHTVTVARDSGIILWTAKMPFQVDLVLIGPAHEKAIFHQLTRMWTTHGVGNSESMVAGECISVQPKLPTS